MEAAPKSKRIFHSIAARVQAVNRLEQGESTKKVAADIGCDESTVRKWKRKSAELARVSGSATAHKSLRRAYNENMEKELYEWVVKKRLAGYTVTGLEIRRKAVEINRHHGGPAGFECTSGWLARFNNRHDMKSGRQSQGMTSADKPDFRTEVEEEGYERDDVYNFDEGGVCYKALPSRSYVLCTGSTKVQRDKITIGVCANASGSHKLPLLLIGKSAMPRCFRSRREMDALPVIYRANKNAWMTQRLWLEYVQDIFIPAVMQKQLSEGRVGKVILVVDDASSHNTPEEYEFGRFKILFLPPNTSSLQPMEQGILAKIKQEYRRQLVDRLLRSGLHIVDFYKTITVKDACIMLADVWEEVSPEDVERAWYELLPPSDQSSVLPLTPSPDGTMEFLELMNSKDAAEALTDVETRQWFRDIETAEGGTEDPEGNPEESSDEEGDDRPTVPEARTAWATVKTFLLERDVRANTVQDIDMALGEVPKQELF